ncbi:MAG TPA: DUF4159 domain-containing protein [Longimicrobiales bacterium]|nr:DUF4159 domain-containing protein [Longimicrobiales bacterium]
MWLPPRARPTLATAAACALLAGCGADEPPGRADRGAGLLTQQAPQVRRPTPPEEDDDVLHLPPADEPAGRHAFYWTRAVYSGYGRGWYGGRGSWSTDFPKGDRQFLLVLKRLVRLDAYDWENAISLADPRLRNHPMIYAVEVGYMDLTEAEVHGLRDYLNAGGLLVVDDFWGSREWAVFEHNIRRVLPGRSIVDLPLDHPLFSTYYEIDEIKQVPARGNGINGRPTWERDGVVPYVKGIFDDAGHLMVLINWNTDLGDAWEWAELPWYPLEYSTYAYEMGANMIVYGMSR